MFYKRLMLMLLCAGLLFIACNDDDDNDDNNNSGIDYRQEMRQFVINISEYGRNVDSDFIIIPQNGQEILFDEAVSEDTPATEYINAIDGVGREDLYYGYNEDNVATPETEVEYMEHFLDFAEDQNVQVLTTDYCSDTAYMHNSYVRNEDNGYISFAASSRDLEIIPEYPSEPYNVNSNDILSLEDARNFLYIINPMEFPVSTDFINTLSETNFDIIIMDAFFDDGTMISAAEVEALKSKANGGTRLVISYMSIGEAEDYRYYWQSEWNDNHPVWIHEENPDWAGNYKVKYWEETWQDVILGSENTYLDKILASGFDGVYLDIIDAFEYFENL